MNGYLPKEVLGSPKMFQGEGTNSIVSSEIRAAIKLQESLKTVLNYKKEWRDLPCLIKGYPVLIKKDNLPTILL
jgi:hypothetical protein